MFEREKRKQLVSLKRASRVRLCTAARVHRAMCLLNGRALVSFDRPLCDSGLQNAYRTMNRRADFLSQLLVPRASRVYWSMFALRASMDTGFAIRTPALFCHHVLFINVLQNRFVVAHPDLSYSETYVRTVRSCIIYATTITLNDVGLHRGAKSESSRFPLIRVLSSPVKKQQRVTHYSRSH